MTKGKQYTFTMCVTPAKNVIRFGFYSSRGYKGLANMPVLYDNKKQIISITFLMNYADGKDSSVDITNGYPNICRFPDDGSVTENSVIHWWKLEEGEKATPWIPNVNDDPIAGSFGGAVNKNLAPLGSAITSHYGSTVTWDSANKRYTITSPVTTNTTYGTGFSLKGQYYKLPWNMTYRASMEIYTPAAYNAVLDFNNNTLGNTLSGNDQDSGRTSNAFTIPAKTWTKVSWGTTNKNETKNPNHLNIYPYDGFDILNSTDSASTTWYVRNVKFEYGDTVTPYYEGEFVASGPISSPSFANEFYEI